jgi:hypothetical protein
VIVRGVGEVMESGLGAGLETLDHVVLWS